MVQTQISKEELTEVLNMDLIEVYVGYFNGTVNYWKEWKKNISQRGQLDYTLKTQQK